MFEAKPALPALSLWRSEDTARSLQCESCWEECKIQSDKHGIMTLNVVWAVAIICLTSSQPSAYDPALLSLPAEFIQMLMVLAA